MAKGNDGNYFQHSIEICVALRLTKLSTQGTLHIALTHGMAPFELCETPAKGQSRALLQKALQAAQKPSIIGEPPIVEAYRVTKASLEHYPNTGELLAGTVGRRRLSGGITEVDVCKHAELVDAWSGSSVKPVNSSWRCEVGPGGILSCPATLHSPWLFTADPMTFREDRYADDDKLYREDLLRVSATLEGFIASGEPGVAALFVYAVRPKDRPWFWDFTDDVAANCGIPVRSCWIPHQGGNRNLAALFYSGVILPANSLPHGVIDGRD